MQSKKDALTVSDVHFHRYFRHHELGKSIEEIAQEERVGKRAILKSIAAVLAYRARFSVATVTSEQAKLLCEVSELEKAALQRALSAVTKTVEWDDEGEPHFDLQPDHDTALRASEIITQKFAAMQPKGGKGLTVSTNVGVVAGGQGGISAPRGFTIEERIRELQNKRQMALTEGISEEPSVDEAEATSEG